METDKTQLISNLRERVKEHAHHEHQLRDFYLTRWLVARNWNVDNAAEMYIKSMEWRKENDVDNIYKNFPKENPEFFEPYHAYWPGRYVGNSIDGWCVTFECFGRLDPNSLISNTTTELRNKYNIWKMEDLDEKRRQIEDKLGCSAGITMVTDLTGLGLSHVSSSALQVFKDITMINKNNYPEALRRQFIINAPTMFTMAWKLISPWLDPSTLDKTSVQGSDYLEALKQVMSLDVIPSDFGGNGPSIPTGGIYNPKNAGFEQITVPRSGNYEQIIKVSKSGSVIEWEFKTEYYDISFSVEFIDGSTGEKKCLIKNSVVDAHISTIKGNLVAEKEGKYILVWDNSYSWTRSKILWKKVSLIEK